MPSLAVLTGLPVRAVDAAAAAAALAAEPHQWVLTTDTHAAAVTAGARARGIALTPHAHIRGFDYTHGRWVTLALLSVRAALSSGSACDDHGE